MSYGWIILALLVVVAGLRLRARRAQLAESRRRLIDDEAIRQILEIGELDVTENEPLDLRHIEEEERRFFSETWDEPEEL